MSNTKRRMMSLFLAIVMAVLMMGTLTAVSAGSIDQLTDVKEHWGYEAIKWVVDNGYMVGVSSTEFNPNGTVTRAHIIQILYNMAGKPDVEGFENPYKDVEQGAWYAEAAVWAYRRGVTGNNSGIYFNPNECVPREQIALMFELYALRVDTSNQKAKFALKDEYMSRFTDLGCIGNEILYNAMNWSVQYGLITGVSETELAPKAYTTRAMMAQIIKNYYWEREPEPDETNPSATNQPAVTNPPVSDPPVTNPPVTNPPVTNPPVSDPPVSNPPVTNPPVSDPPVSDPPALITPGGTTPGETPAVTNPPASDPPALITPGGTTPGETPTVTNPPASDPPPLMTPGGTTPGEVPGQNNT